MFLTDALGSLVATTDAVGGMQSELTYEPFGNTEMSSPAPAHRFTGREHDEPMYLYYYRARYYHTDLQRFISEDPLGLAAGDVNFYAYVANNPLSFIDPFGLDKDQCSAGGGALAGAANFSAGFGDILTSGLGLSYAFGLPSGTEAIRTLWMETPGLPTTGAPDVVNPKCSWAYTSGQIAGVADAIAIAALGTAAAAGYETVIWFYPNAVGVGINILKGGERIFGLDWHRFKLAGNMVNRPHVHFPGSGKHWPWGQ